MLGYTPLFGETARKGGGYLEPTSEPGELAPRLHRLDVMRALLATSNAPDEIMVWENYVKWLLLDRGWPRAFFSGEEGDDFAGWFGRLVEGAQNGGAGTMVKEILEAATSNDPHPTYSDQSYGSWATPI
jgi:hypothetical protein